MSTMIGIIGLASGILQNINTALSFFPPQDQTKTRIRVYAGLSLSTDSSESTSGNIPGVAAWDVGGSFIGKAMGIYNYVVDEGNHYDLEIKGRKSSAEYISVSAFGKDGLCVAAVGVTSPTGYQAGWFGDVGMKCGAPWYPSNYVIPGSSPEVRPACVWIDQDGSNSHLNKALTVHLPSFTGEGLANEYNGNINAMCKSLPRFSMWTSRTPHMTLPVFQDKLEFNDDGSDEDLEKVVNPRMMESETTAPNDPTGTKLGVAEGASASVVGPVVEVPSSRRRRRRMRRETGNARSMYDQLVISNVTSSSHSARELCGSVTSVGPDFVSIPEGLFCDMEGKTLWPVCGGVLVEGCFDVDRGVMKWDEHETLEGKLQVRGEGTSEKTYRGVQRWE